MDEADRIKITQALEMSRADYTIRWYNPNTGIEYSVTPARTYETALGPCREFTAQAMIDGQRQSARGSACRQLNGIWQASPLDTAASVPLN
jgi:surface antigen